MGIDHDDGDLSVTVTSVRSRKDGLAELGRWVAEGAVDAALAEYGDSESGEVVSTQDAARLRAAGDCDDLIWDEVTIPVDGQSQLFRVFGVMEGWWVAVGRGADADLAIDSRHVPLAGLELVRVTDLPIPQRMRRPRRPRRPSRQFPADDARGVVAVDAQVELIVEPHGLLSGSVGGRPVRLDLDPAFGEAAGSIAGLAVSASWENGDNSGGSPDVPSALRGSFAGQSVDLHATFHFDDLFFEHGTISGQIGADDLDATIEPASGGLSGSRDGPILGVAVDGTFGASTFVIYAAIDGARHVGLIRGTVAAIPFRIDVTSTPVLAGRRTHLSGGYQGPMALLALGVGAVLHFM